MDTAVAGEGRFVMWSITCGICSLLTRLVLTAMSKLGDIYWPGTRDMRKVAVTGDCHTVAYYEGLLKTNT
jgi:hypothetical protein